jgi:hypothetical protein
MLEYFEKLAATIEFKQDGKPYWITKPKHSRWSVEAPAGTVRKDGRRRIRCTINGVGKLILAHRLAWFINTEEIPTLLDHKDRNPDNSSVFNLRKATPSENAQNRRVSITNKVGVTGVTYDTTRRQYRAAITIEGIRYRKRFTNLAEAVAWRKEQEVLLHPFRPDVLTCGHATRKRFR